MPTAPHGSWPSPVTVEMMTSASVGLGAPTVDGPDLLWTETRADQGGRTTLLRRSGDSDPVELTPEPSSVRTRVHEYGGGAFAARNGEVVFANYTDGRLYRVTGPDEPTPFTPAEALRYGDLRLHPERNLVLAVREDHRGAGEAVNTIVALDLDGPNPDGGVVLATGADFYACPELGSTGRLAWTEWDHPAMPWDATRVRVADLTGDSTPELRLTGPQQVAGGPAESAVHPRWTPDGRLVFLSDRTDWWNVYVWSEGVTRALHPAEEEFCSPMWELGQNPYAVVDEDRLLVTRHGGAGSGPAILDCRSGDLVPVGPATSFATSVSAEGSRAATVLTSQDRAPVLVELDLAAGSWSELRRASEVEIEPGMTSRAQAVTWPSDSGPVHGWFYPPTNAHVTAPPGDLPPLVTHTHGGPTAYSGPSFRLGVQYWTSRGIAVLDVNYGGSSGYGRAYRDRLRGRWGLVDVGDCAAGAAALGERGLVDPGRLAISGGSAGGYTTLRALTATDVFHAGISHYGVGDLESLARDTHKFESRYLDGLVGPYPAARDTYRDRSPVHHVDSLSAPILLLQGTDDQVVPPNQAEAMAAAARAKGLPVALIMFPGEGHGFRRAENIRAAVEAELAFLGQVFGFVPADELPPIPLELPDRRLLQAVPAQTHPLVGESPPAEGETPSTG